MFKIDSTIKAPGLSPYLTPIFFDIEVLVKYLYNTSYQCSFCSETYGTIYGPNESFYLPFGINPNKKVIAWLGDIEKLNSKERLYLASHNIDSDGNIKSEFYDSQIEIQFTDPIIEVELILFKTKLSKLTNELFKFKLYNTTDHEISDIVNDCSKYKRIVFNSEDDIKRIVSEWNEILIEDLNKNNLERILDKNDIKIEEEGSLKQFEKFIKNILKINDNIIAPLFYLYDLRLWADHNNTQSYYNEVLTKLSLQTDVAYSTIYKKLIDEIYNFYETLCKKLINIKK